jgi:hypothetical protein
MSMEKDGGMISTGGKSWFAHKISGNPTNSHLLRSSRNGRRNCWVWFCDVFLFIFPKWFFTCRKISTTLGLRLCFPSDGRRAADFYRPQNPSPVPALNQRTLGPIASTLTSTPPKWINLGVSPCQNPGQNRSDSFQIFNKFAVFYGCRSDLANNSLPPVSVMSQLNVIQTFMLFFL